MPEPTLQQLEQYENFLKQLEEKSATVLTNGEPGTAILYSGEYDESGNIRRNRTEARNCAKERPGSYTIHDTEAGKFLDQKVVPAYMGGAINEEQYRELWSQGSEMMVREAKGPALALVKGATDINSTFMTREVPLILKGESGITSLNGVDTSLLQLGKMSNPVNAQNLLEILDPRSKCFDDPPSGGAGAVMSTSSLLKTGAKVLIEGNVPNLPNKELLSAEKTILQMQMQMLVPRVPHMELPAPEGELGTTGLITRGLVGAARVIPLSYNNIDNNAGQNPDLHKKMTENSALAQNIANTVGGLRESGVSLQHGDPTNVSAPYPRGDQISKTPVSAGLA